jgi:hypothetical protein
MKNTKFYYSILATLMIGGVFAVGVAQNSNRNFMQDVQAAETTLTIKGNAAQLSTTFQSGDDITSYCQGVDSNIVVKYYRRGGSTTYSPFNNTAQQIRLYNKAGDQGQYITITTNPGYSIKEVTVNWEQNNYGNCNYTNSVLTPIDKCSCSIENIGNSQGTANGQVRINSISLTYKTY